MALTGGRVAASIYRINQYDLKNLLGTGPAIQGITYNFPANQCNFYPAPASTVANGVTMNSIIQELPEGLVVNSKYYYTDSTITQLLANGS